MRPSVSAMGARETAGCKVIVNIAAPFLTPIMVMEGYIEGSHGSFDNSIKSSNLWFSRILPRVLRFSCLISNALVLRDRGPGRPGFTLGIIRLQDIGDTKFTDIVLKSCTIL